LYIFFYSGWGWGQFWRYQETVGRRPFADIRAAPLHASRLEGAGNETRRHVELGRDGIDQVPDRDLVGVAEVVDVQMLAAF